MRFRRGLGLAVAAALAVALGACDGGGGGDARDRDRAGGTSITTADDTTTSSDPGTGPGASPTPAVGDDPQYAVPGTIDEAYVTRVLAVLDELQGDVVRNIVATGSFSPADVVPLRAVFNDPELTAQTQAFAQLVESIDKARNPPGNNRSSVTRLLTARPDCIYAETTVDLSETVLEPPPPSTAYVALRPSQADSDPQRLNPTPFSIAAEHLEEANPCG